MKKAKKIITLVMAAVLLMCATVAVTVAYLTSTTETVTNTFAVGDVEITLDEALVTLYGVPATGVADTNDVDGDSDTEELIPDREVDTIAEADRVLENKYKLLPGHKYVKDPTVHVAVESEESYIRMIVTITKISDVKKVLGFDEATGYFLPQDFVEGWDETKWLTTNVVKEDAVANTATYEFRYYKTVNSLGADKALDLEPLFTHIVIPEGINNDDDNENRLELLKDMEIKVVAHAIQADGFKDLNDDGTAVDEAWAAFDTK